MRPTTNVGLYYQPDRSFVEKWYCDDRTHDEVLAALGRTFETVDVVVHTQDAKREITDLAKVHDGQILVVTRRDLE